MKDQKQLMARKKKKNEEKKGRFVMNAPQHTARVTFGLRGEALK